MIVTIFLLPGMLPVQNSQPDPEEIMHFNKMAGPLQSSEKDSLSQGEGDLQTYVELSAIKSSNRSNLYVFDPNTASSNDWQRFGLREKTIHTIQNYLSKGGHFFKAEDIRKIFGLRQEEYKRLIPYIRIVTAVKELPIERMESNSSYSIKSSKASTRIASLRKPSNVEVNTADTSAWIALPGIGNKLANRIINFRNKLGGFYSIDQVAETYGLPDTTFQKIKPFLSLENSTVNRIDLNTADVATFSQHPYISWNIANALVQYRKQHGKFEKVEDIQLVAAISPDLAKKIIPYLVAD